MFCNCFVVSVLLLESDNAKLNRKSFEGFLTIHLEKKKILRKTGGSPSLTNLVGWAFDLTVKTPGWGASISFQSA